MAAYTSLFTTLSVLLLSFVLLSFCIPLSGAADTLPLGQSLSGKQTISSKDGTFELGFFSPGNSSGRWYLAVRFRSIPAKTIVWVANREAPLSDPATSELRLSPDGELVLLNQSKIPVWSSNSSVPGLPNSTVAVLLNTGNLVLRDGSVASTVFWQSFDHPGDTLLPGAKIGFNGTEGKIWKLVSWKNKADPSPGLYSMELESDPSGAPQIIIQRNRSRNYWTSGPWDGHIFSLTPEMMALHEYSIDPSSGPNATYFTYADHEVGGLSTMWIDVSGRWMWQKWSEDIQQWVVFSFMPRDPCDVYAGCGPFGTCSPHNTPYCDCLRGFEPGSMAEWNLGDTSGGCTRKTQLQCGSNISSAAGQRDGFLKMSNVRLPLNPLFLTVPSVQECEQACSSDCSCTAYSYGGNCSLWKGGLLNLKQLNDGEASSGPSGDLFLRLAASELPEPSKKKASLAPALAGALAGFVALLFIVSLLLWRRSHGRRVLAKRLAAQGFLVPFRYRELQSATKNFSEKLGKGGFGSVFKGTLPDASVVAVKKLEGLGQGDKQFRMEVSAMAAVQHVNVIRLRGFCSEGTKRLLVYDYMPNGSLDCYLYPKNVEGLDWGRRFQIAVGTARGLAYLHEKCRDCIIHCDVKPENILLDEAFQPKVADFGMAKLVGRDFSRVLTTMRGTLGYLAPEWITGVPITPKADVYSFGMMLFEIISGRRNWEDPEEGRPSFFPAWVAMEVSDKEAADFQGYELGDPANKEELRRACRVACWCIQEDEGDRPPMGQVVQMLEGVVEVEMPPVPTLLQNHVANGDEIVFMLEMRSFASSKASSSGVSTKS